MFIVAHLDINKADHAIFTVKWVKENSLNLDVDFRCFLKLIIWMFISAYFLLMRNKPISCAMWIKMPLYQIVFETIGTEPSRVSWKKKRFWKLFQRNCFSVGFYLWCGICYSFKFRQICRTISLSLSL